MSKDVAALRVAAEHVIRAADAHDAAGKAAAALTEEGKTLTIELGNEPPEWLAMRAASEHEKQAINRLKAALWAAPDAILIDPTAPETVAALAEALRERTPFQGGTDYTARNMAAAILPAFVARLRGET